MTGLSYKKWYVNCPVFFLGPVDGADEPCDAFVVEETERGYQCAVDVPSPLYK